MTEIKLPEVGQHVRLAANAEEGWPEEVGEWLGDGVLRLLECYRFADTSDDGLRDIDLIGGQEVWSIVEDDEPGVGEEPRLTLVLTVEEVEALLGAVVQAVDEMDETYVHYEALREIAKRLS